MARKNSSEDTVKVSEVPQRAGVHVGKPGKVVTTSMRTKVAFPLSGGVTTGSGGNFYSPELSTDFLELPQSIDEQRNYYRFFYDYEPFVAQAIDLHTEIPLSKLRIGIPKAQNRELAEKAKRFCIRWAKKVRLLQRLMEIVHDFNLLGEVYIFCEDTSSDTPREIRAQAIREITSEGEAIEKWEEYPDADAREVAWLSKNYLGWTAIRVLPPEQIKMESFGFTDEKLIELIPDSKTKNIIEKARQGDPQAQRIVASMPEDIVQAILSGGNLPLNTDPDAGSFVYYLARKRSQYDPHGKSLIQRCLLPGTPIWIKRNGIIQQVAVEEVNDQIDTLLTHKGRFMPCKAGSRQVDENVTVLEIEGVEQPLKLTSDHKVLRIAEDGSESWVEAGKLLPGDMVREGQVAPSETPITEIDLAAWWKGRNLKSEKRGRPKLGLEKTIRDVNVTNVTTENNALQVTFSYENDNRNRAEATEGLGKLLTWASSLSEPKVLTQAQVAELSGISERDVRVYAPRLRKEGLLKSEDKSLGRGRGKQITWYPSEHKTLPLESCTYSSPMTKIQLTEDFCYLLGTWLGDGCVWTENETLLNTPSIGWSLHEEEARERISKLVSDIFSKCVIKTGCMLDETAENKDLRVEDLLLARWFMEEFGHTAQGKHLPEWIFSLPESKILALLRGMLDTDGSLKQEPYPYITIELDNKVLLDQIHLLCNRLGLNTQVKQTLKKARTWTRSWKTKTGIKTKTYEYSDKEYTRISCSSFSDVQKWAGVSSIKGSRVAWDLCPCKDKSKKYNLRITDTYTLGYSGSVYSFDVGTDNSHITSIVTHNCLRTLVQRDKLRQALTSISSRHMTPYRLIYAEDMDDLQTEALREQVDLALQDPDYSIITNFEVHWEEMGAEQRLPDWSWFYELTDRQLYAGLGVTESLLSGESSYSGDRINLEVINTRWMLLRELLQDLVEEYFFKPMCRRMGFIEDDEDGNEMVIVPSLSFTRLALRDNADTFDALYNLYTKGSVDIDVILELLNIDPVETREKLERDLFTPNDALFNEVLRGLYQRAGDALSEGSDATEKIAKALKLKYEKKQEPGRF